ncbi:MAG TPA: hypothetical protein VKT77_18150 [Chthonomonadaceae bacterium]|nr:hypothetical protein [Chthonomonadaceae bacterium]
MAAGFGGWKRLAAGALTGALFVCGAGAAFERGLQAQSADTRILRRSEALYNTLVRVHGPIHQAETQFDIRRADGDLVSQAQIEIGPGGDGKDTVFNWNRRTGDLIRLRMPPIGQLDLRTGVLDKDQAARVGERWLRILGVAGRSAEWRLASDPAHDDHCRYTVTWISGTLRVRLIEDDRDGDLLQADITPRSFAP